MNKDVQNPFIGIFWGITERGHSLLLCDKVPLIKGELYGDAITWGEHYNFWEELRSQKLPHTRTQVPAWSEYDEWPRGRVIYQTQKEKFIVYADQKLLTETARQAITKAFSLPTPDTYYYSDSHYKSIRIIPKLKV